jgi:hypothetical protein
MRGSEEAPGLSDADAFDWLNAAIGHVIRQYVSQPSTIEDIVSAMKAKLNSLIDGRNYLV